MQWWRRWWFAFVGAVVLLEEGLSAISRGAHGRSDLGVFYRTAVLLAQGASGTVYAGRDVVSGWYRCIPPAGMMWFAPLAALSARTASCLWTCFNFALALLGAFALGAILKALRDEGNSRAQEALPFAIGLLFGLGAPSVEVGQFSLMFVVCWLGALWYAVRHKFEVSALALALPTSIKIYPLLMLLAPLGTQRPVKWPRFIVTFALGCAFWTWIVPCLFYGARTGPLEQAFWHDVVMSPQGRLSESQNVQAVSNHGLDAVLLRFGSNLPEPAGAPPHLHFASHAVLELVNPLRLLLSGLTLLVWWRRQSEEGNAHALLNSAALWSATLFLILPGAKARYAVYTLIAFMPLVLHATSLFQTRAAIRWVYAGFTALLAVLVMSLVPTEARLWEAGFWGALLLWLENGRLLLQASPQNFPQTFRYEVPPSSTLRLPRPARR